MRPETILEVKGIVKDFPGVRALDQVSFELRKGEVHVLVGENGAGKSTLMKILAGAYAPDEGKIFIHGKETKIQSPKHAQDLGISIIYQEFNLIPYLDVASNIFLGREKMLKGLPWVLDHKKMLSESQSLLESLNAYIDPSAFVNGLAVAQQQLVEVAKALSLKADILIMDEPTSVLGAEEIKKLFDTIGILKSRGISIIYISHRLEEIFGIGDRVTVLRDGRNVETSELKNVAIPDVIRMMVGEHVETLFPRNVIPQKGAEAIRLVNVSKKGVTNKINLSIRYGEIVGLAGVVGSGRTEVANLIFGEKSYDEGEIWIFGNRTKRINPTRAVSMGIGFLPEDRKRHGLNLRLSVKENITMASLNSLFPHCVIDNALEKETVEKFIVELGVATPSINRLVKFLSGGNQQKVVLAKWLCRRSKIFIFDEPTRGIDVGAKAEVHRLMDSLVSKGAAVMMISSDLPEILNMSDRIYVMHHGTIIKEFSRDQATKEEVLFYATTGGNA